MITLVLGGTRSGKSAAAEAIAQSYSRPVTYVATAAVEPTDADHRARIAAHQARRPGHWATVECTSASSLAQHLRADGNVALVDSLGTWVTLHHDLVVDPTELLATLKRRASPTVIVSEEVGLAVHPQTEIGRRYVDAMGTLNQQVAEVAERVLFVVAGRAIDLSTPGGYLQ
ncbi:MAG: adenosylcobinamide kinase/adenosylcobinamide-phosphate guanylyltransferase [Acidimicrobiales bacterium]|jgi:adenosylcobinamide kinase/adenosylcobinamide-phosphate guanylyltransferase